MCVLLRNLMLAVQSINFACMDFGSPYLVQMGAEIRRSMADVDKDSLLSQNWPSNTCGKSLSWLGVAMDAGLA